MNIVSRDADVDHAPGRIEVDDLSPESSDTINDLDTDGILVGGTGADILHGNGGNDRIYSFEEGIADGGVEQDVLTGDAGDDILWIGYGDSADGGSGTDTLILSLTGASGGVTLDTLAFTDTGSGIIGGGVIKNIERVEQIFGSSFGDNITLHSQSSIATVRGYGGNDRLTGSDGDDILDGGDGHDILNGRGGKDTLIGGAGDDRMGGAHADTMIGGDGNDNYEVESVGDVVTELENEGHDTVSTSLPSYTLGANVESLNFIGWAHRTGTGNDLNNWIEGQSGNDVLSGLGGNDILTGGGGYDKLIGGIGNDWYTVHDFLDVIVEVAGEGDVDQIGLWANDGVYTLPDEVEGLALYGMGVRAHGNSLANTIFNAELRTNNWLYGEGGNDTLIGNSTDETLIGGEGDDVITGGAGNDIIEGGGGDDSIDGGAGIDTASYNTATGGVTVSLAISGIQGTGAASADTLANIENLVGSGFDDVLAGSAEANLIDGGAGADTMTGGAGNDIYVVDTSADHIVEAADGGIDTVEATVSYALGAFLENLTLTGSAAIDGTGNGLANTLTGNSAANTLDGGTGADAMGGGSGDDRYLVDNPGDKVIETVGGGVDLVQSLVSFALGDEIEKLTLMGSAAINGTGNALVNALIGNAAANTLDGGSGADAMTGNGGDDRYIVDNAGDLAIETAGGGIDLVLSSVSYSLGVELENLTLTANAVTAVGNSLANTLTGNASANLLDGSLGADTMIGGAGDDSYIVDNVGDQIDEAVGSIAGVDTVQSSVSHTLGANVENLILTGSGAIGGSGNGLANAITGNGAANALSGGDGDDRLDGGAGSDTMTGGGGNDVFVVDSAIDKAIEVAGGGIDTVESAVTFTLGAEIEKLTLTGAAAVNGTGNGLANTLTGNSAANTLDGGAGADAMAGGTGDDKYIVDNAGDTVTEAAGGGNDLVQSSVSFTLGDEIEKLTLTGAAAINATGNALANTLVGNAAANTLDGRGGADNMVGGGGDDRYIVDNAGDFAVEAAGGGVDTVVSSVSFTLGAEVENLTLTGTEAINAVGNSLANVLTGNAAANLLNGGVGADTMIGGAGDDRYMVDHAGDLVIEAAGSGNGVDTVQSSVDYTLGANVEKLTLTGSAASGTGNSLANVIAGNASANTLRGAEGDDQLFGDLGSDTLDGGIGKDRLDGGSGADAMSGGAGDDTYVVDHIGDQVVEAANQGTDTVEASVSYTLSDNVENLTIIGNGAFNATGNALANVLTGNSAANTLDGGSGWDRMSGGGGNDSYVVDAIGDKVFESAGGGIDTVLSAVNFVLGDEIENLTLTGTAINATGNALANMLTGNAVANVLDGAAGADRMAGGGGDDRYMVDDAGDMVVEAADGGIDLVQSSVSFALGAYVEKLVLTGTAAIDATGNTLANTLVGNAGANTLDGGMGADNMVGGAGDDIYVVDNSGDYAIEASGGGIDTVLSSIGYTLGAEVEKLTLTGSLSVGANGNALDNVLTGNIGSNTLNGGIGADTMIGGTGDDRYIVDNLGDQVIELANEGVDQVQSSVTFTLGDHVERLTLAGTSAIDGTGNDQANTIVGNAYANRLDGGGGNDRLQGGAGSDVFAFGPGSGADEVIDFTRGADKIDLSAYGIDSFAEVQAMMSQSGAHTVIDLGGGDTITLDNILNNRLTESDFLLAAPPAMAMMSSDEDAALMPEMWGGSATMMLVL